MDMNSGRTSSRDTIDSRSDTSSSAPDEYPMCSSICLRLSRREDGGIFRAKFSSRCGINRPRRARSHVSALAMLFLLWVCKVCREGLNCDLLCRLKKRLQNVRTRSFINSLPQIVSPWRALNMGKNATGEISKNKHKTRLQHGQHLSAG